MSNIKITENYTWMNIHANVAKSGVRRYEIENIASKKWRAGLEGIQDMIRQARSRTERLRSYGGKWSLSDAAVCNDNMHNSKPLKYCTFIRDTSLTGNALFPDDPRPVGERIYFFQSGLEVGQVNDVLESRDLALATSGASDGQTIAGAISTGTHGSALRIGAMQDYVRALHIVTHEDKHVLIQPKTNPVVKDSFADVLDTELITDDSMFQSALVSFGSFGVIHAVILEAVSLYALESYCMRVDYNAVESIYPALAAFDHGSSTNLTGFMNGFALPDDKDPYHVRIIVNPYSSSGNAFLEVMYKRPYDPNQLTPIPSGARTRVGDDILTVVGNLATGAGFLVSHAVNMFFGDVAEVHNKFIQTPGNIFGPTNIVHPASGGASVELGIPIAKAQAAVRLVMQTASKEGFMGVIGVRFVKNTNATLGFTRFAPLTCTIEVPGMNTPETQNFYRQLFKDLDAAGMPFTLHWGQEGDYSINRLHSMYGGAVQTWEEDRRTLLPESVQRYMFTNDFVKRCGLAEPMPVIVDNSIG